MKTISSSDMQNPRWNHVPVIFPADESLVEPTLQSGAEVNRSLFIRREENLAELSPRERELVSMFHYYESRANNPLLAAALLIINELSGIREMQELFTPAEVGKRVRTSAETVIAWIRSGQLTASNISTSNRPRYLIQREWLRQFLESRRVQPQSSQRRNLKATQHAYRRFSEA